MPGRAKGLIRRLVLGYDHFAPSFAAAGEDMILRHVVGSERQQGFFVDVGAFHPNHSSNTYFFHTQGNRPSHFAPAVITSLASFAEK
jgi:hypothetical protein